jgi:glycerol-3-phosphate dehydrogenase (NAD(P)+)
LAAKSIRVAIVGAGAWGTALAITLARAGNAVRLCARRPDHLAAMRRFRENSEHLPGVALPVDLQLTEQSYDAMKGIDAVLMAVPSQFARVIMRSLGPSIAPEALVVSVTKGIEQVSLATMTTMLAEVAPQVSRIAALSGPGFALEIAQGRPAALVAAAADNAVARDAQQILAVRPLRIYRSIDIIGVELGGAVKNVTAIAAGISDGLELGSSARAALITRGLAEIIRLAEAMGAQPSTMAGLAGLGDLVLTCTSNLSRNRRLGLALAGAEESAGMPVGSVAEGVSNACSIRQLAHRHEVEMPIVEAVYRILYEDAAAPAMVEELLNRELKAEF